MNEQKILSVSEKEVEQILKILPELELIKQERGVLAQGSATIQLIQSEGQESILQVFLLEFRFRDRRGLGSRERYPEFRLPVRREQLIHLLELLETLLRPSFENRVLDRLGRIEKAILGEGDSDEKAAEESE